MPRCPPRSAAYAQVISDLTGSGRIALCCFSPMNPLAAHWLIQRMEGTGTVQTYEKRRQCSFPSARNQFLNENKTNKLPLRSPRSVSSVPFHDSHVPVTCCRSVIYTSPLLPGRPRVATSILCLGLKYLFSVHPPRCIYFCQSVWSFWPDRSSELSEGA